MQLVSARCLSRLERTAASKTDVLHLQARLALLIILRLHTRVGHLFLFLLPALVRDVLNQAPAIFHIFEFIVLVESKIFVRKRQIYLLDLFTDVEEQNFEFLFVRMRFGLIPVFDLCFPEFL